MMRNERIETGMAAYAAIVSLIHLMEQIELYHDFHLIFQDEQKSQLESLRQKVSFLQDFLEKYSSSGNNELEALEGQIVSVAYEAEDVIESYIVHAIQCRSRNKNIINRVINLVTSIIKWKNSANNFFQSAQQVIKRIDSINEEAVEYGERRGVPENPRPRELGQASSSVLPVSRTEEGTVTGLKESLETIMDKLTARESSRQVITITGMGGIGKSTLAQNIYGKKVIEQHFDVRGSIRVSQEFDVQEIFLGLLQELGVPAPNKLNKAELGQKLYQLLYGRRYLIVIDDIWDLEAWDGINRFLPSEFKGSRILITTRLSNLASILGSSYIHEMKLLNKKQSWSLLCKKVSAKVNCPAELIKIGKEIANSCRGLPLSISVIGGLLTKSMTLEYWENVASDVSSFVNLTDEERCLKILYMSYDHLPIHLKPCFLYFGFFPEDREIRVSQLIHLWVAEGFLKPMEDKSLEDVAYHYLNDLIGRNLIVASQVRTTGNIRCCRIHDLLRDLCLEVGKENFLHVTSVFDCPHVNQVPSTARRLAYGDMPIWRHHYVSNDDFMWPVQLLFSRYMRLGDLFPEFNPDLLSSPLRSLISQVKFNLEQSVDGKLMRVCIMEHGHPEKVFTKLLNSRYLDFGQVNSRCIIPSSINLLWNLQTIILNGGDFVAPYEIWEMPQLRHIMMWNVLLPDPSDGPNCFVLVNLQTLLKIINFRCTEEVIRRIPNVRKLKMIYEEPNMLSSYCLSNLGRLEKLESLCCHGPSRGDIMIRSQFLVSMEFPISLKELTLRDFIFHWKDMTAKIGPLPCLEVLKVIDCHTDGKWRVEDEDDFPCLKYLKIENTNLDDWKVYDTDFPCLESLVLWDMESELDLPTEIGSIPTLQLIDVEGSSKTIVDSAKRIIGEQREFSNAELQLVNENWVQDRNATAVTITRIVRNTQARERVIGFCY